MVLTNLASAAGSTVIALSNANATFQGNVNIGNTSGNGYPLDVESSATTINLARFNASGAGSNGLNVSGNNYGIYDFVGMTTSPATSASEQRIEEHRSMSTAKPSSMAYRKLQLRRPSDYYNGNSAWGIGVDDTAVANSSAFLYMELNGTEIGDITNVNNTGISYNTTSDRRLKENIATTTAGLCDAHANPRRRLRLHRRPDPYAGAGLHRAVALLDLSGSRNNQRGRRPLCRSGPTSTPWAVDYGRLTPLIVSAVQDIANISSTFEQNLIAWLGNAQNGIGEFFAQVGNFGHGQHPTVHRQRLE